MMAAALACSDADAGRDARGTLFAVTSDHQLATDAAMAVLDSGGNAMDAAITAAGVLGVVRPHMNGVGGDLFLLYYDAASGRVWALNASGRSGSGATPAALRDSTAFPAIGPMSVSVPGAVSGWAAALERFGTLSFAEALGPANRLAHEGFTVSERLARDFTEERDKLAAEPSAALYLDVAAGTVLRQHELGATLDRLRANGPDEFYRGETGRRIVEFLTARGGFLTTDDLAAHAAEWVDPISLGYRGLTVLAFPPNTQGLMLLETLALIERFDLATLGHNAPDYFHVLAEALRLAVADRDSSVADPAAMRVTVEQLLALERLSALSAGIDPAGNAPDPGRDAPDHPNTVYVSVVDSAGNAVSLIQSLFHAFGSGLVASGTGVVLHNRGSLFSLDPEHPNIVAPSKRPYHTLSPAMAFRDGRPWLVFGTPGGDGQVHTLTQVLNNILLFGMSPQEAIDAPRLRRLPSGALAIEDRVPADVLAALEARGYVVRPRAGWTAEFGGAQAILVTGDSLIAGADRRREAFARAR